MKKILLIILSIMVSMLAFSQARKPIVEEPEPPMTRILFIFDASMSMSDKWEGGQKFVKARELMFELLDSLERVQKKHPLEVALRVYGHQSPVPPQDCTDSKLEVSFGESTIGIIRDKLMSITPKGTTPIAYSLGKSEGDFPDDKEARNIIILITDGIEMCNGDPCEVSAALQKKGVVLKPYIIGINIDVKQADMLACMGNYFDAGNERQFRQAITTIVSEVTSLTAVRVNLLDSNGKPTETNVAMSFHDMQSGDVRYTYMHTMNAAGQPDTIYLDVLSQYKLKVHTVPPVYKDGITIEEGKLNIIDVPAPQGTLLVDIKGEDPANADIKCIIRETGLPHTIHTIDADRKQKLIVGQYDLEILTMPRTYVNAVRIDQGKLRKIDIPQPGTVIINFRSPAFGTLLHQEGDRLTDIYEFSPDKTHYKLRLQPGYYRVVFRDQHSHSAKNSAEFKFRVKEGEMSVQNL